MILKIRIFNNLKYFFSLSKHSFHLLNYSNIFTNQINERAIAIWLFLIYNQRHMKNTLRILLKVFLSLILFALLFYIVLAILYYMQTHQVIGNSMCGCPECPMDVFCDCLCELFFGISVRNIFLVKVLSFTRLIILPLGIPTVGIVLFNKFILRKKNAKQRE